MKMAINIQNACRNFLDIEHITSSCSVFWLLHGSVGMLMMSLQAEKAQKPTEIHCTVTVDVNKVYVVC